MKIPQQAIAEIKHSEGLRLDAYLCPANVLTIGYGVTRINGRPVRRGDRLSSEKEAYDLLIQQLTQEFIPPLTAIPGWSEMSEGQQSALISFAWNLGAKFYKAPGFETLTARLQNRQWDQVPAALSLYIKGMVKGKLVTIPGLVTRREREIELWDQRDTTPSKPSQSMITQYPKTAIANQPFTVRGRSEPGRTIKVLADVKFPLPNVVTWKDGVFIANLSLNQTGDRRLSFADGKQAETILIKVGSGGDRPKVSLSLTRSVGAGGINLLGEVRSVQQRLKDLGYAIGDADGIVGPNTIKQIKLFQSIIQGRSTVAGDGRIDPNGTTHQWLVAGNAPRWIIMPDTNLAIAFRNRELEETWDNHDYGTDWLAKAILEIATHYQSTYRRNNPGKTPFTINDVSVPHGGYTPDHAGHETGLMCDVFLPRKDGGYGLPTYDNGNYDRDACRAMLVSIRQHPLFKLAYFNDPQLIKEGLCRHAGGHHHHIHFEIKPPARKA